MAGSIVQSKFNEAAAAATTIATGSFGSNVTANNWLWILVNGDAADTTTITQNSGTATIGSVTQQSSSIGPGPGILEEWTSLTCQITGTGSLDLLCTFGGSRSNRQILAFEITGVNAVDSGGGASQADGGTNPTPSLSITVGSQPAFCLAACVDYQGGTPGVGTGFTNAGTFGATVNFIRAQTKAITSTGATTGDFVNGGLDVNNSAMIVFDEPSTPTTGALAAQDAAIAGSADHTTAGASHSTSGALAAQDATIAGSATHLTLHTSTGALAAQDATVAGVAAHQHAATGALAAQDATVAGTAAHLTLHASTGALAADAASISGAAAHEHATSGALSAQAATIDGAAEHSAAGTHDATGALAAQDASMSGVAEHIGTGESVLSPKFLGSPNVVIRGVKVEGKAADATPLPAQITNVPDAPPPVKLSPSIMDLLGFAPPVTPLPIETPEIPEFKVTVKPRKEPPAPDPAPEVVPLPPPPPPPPPAPPVDDRMPALVTKVNSLVLKIDAQDQQIAAMEKATAAMVKALENQVNALRSTLAQEKMNRLRAEEITRRLLKDLAEED